MTSHRQRPAHKVWRNWKRISFSSQMLWNKKQQRLCQAPEYDAGQEDTVVLVAKQLAMREYRWANLYLRKGEASAWYYQRLHVATDYQINPQRATASRRQSAAGFV